MQRGERHRGDKEQEEEHEDRTVGGMGYHIKKVFSQLIMSRA